MTNVSYCKLKSYILGDYPLRIPVSSHLPQAARRTPVASEKPLAGHKIMLDPGHGGKDPGAIGLSGLQEKAIVLDVSLEMARQLRELGAEVRMTRDTDVQVSPPGSDRRGELEARVIAANNWPAEIFVSVHANANNNREVKGTEAYVARQSSQNSKVLATAMHNHMVDDLGLPDRRVLKSDFYVIKNTHMPAVLMEIAYLSNPEEEALMADPAFRQKSATAMVAGITDYFTGANIGEVKEPGEPEFLPEPEEMDLAIEAGLLV